MSKIILILLFPSFPRSPKLSFPNQTKILHYHLSLARCMFSATCTPSLNGSNTIGQTKLRIQPNIYHFNIQFTEMIVNRALTSLCINRKQDDRKLAIHLCFNTERTMQRKYLQMLAANKA